MSERSLVYAEVRVLVYSSRLQRWLQMVQSPMAHDVSECVLDLYVDDSRGTYRLVGYIGNTLVVHVPLSKPTSSLDYVSSTEIFHQFTNSFHLQSLCYADGDGHELSEVDVAPYGLLFSDAPTATKFFTHVTSAFQDIDREPQRPDSTPQPSQSSQQPTQDSNTEGTTFRDPQPEEQQQDRPVGRARPMSIIFHNPVLMQQLAQEEAQELEQEKSSTPVVEESNAEESAPASVPAAHNHDHDDVAQSAPEPTKQMSTAVSATEETSASQPEDTSGEHLTTNVQDDDDAEVHVEAVADADADAVADAEVSAVTTGGEASGPSSGQKSEDQVQRQEAVTVENRSPVAATSADIQAVNVPAQNDHVVATEREDDVNSQADSFASVAMANPMAGSNADDEVVEEKSTAVPSPTHQYPQPSQSPPPLVPRYAPYVDEEDEDDDTFSRADSIASSSIAMENPMVTAATRAAAVQADRAAHQSPSSPQPQPSSAPEHENAQDDCPSSPASRPESRSSIGMANPLADPHIDDDADSGENVHEGPAQTVMPSQGVATAADAEDLAKVSETPSIGRQRSGTTFAPPRAENPRGRARGMSMFDQWLKRVETITKLDAKDNDAPSSVVVSAVGSEESSERTTAVPTDGVAIVPVPEPDCVPREPVPEPVTVSEAMLPANELRTDIRMFDASALKNNSLKATVQHSPQVRQMLRDIRAGFVLRKVPRPKESPIYVPRHMLAGRPIATANASSTSAPATGSLQASKAQSMAASSTSNRQQPTPRKSLTTPPSASAVAKRAVQPARAAPPKPAPRRTAPVALHAPASQGEHSHNVAPDVQSPSSSESVDLVKRELETVRSQMIEIFREELAKARHELVSSIRSGHH